MSSERVKPYEERMEKTISHLQTDLQAVRAGRANPHVLDKIRVDYYGSPTPIQQVANVSVPEARIIQIAPWEKKMIKEISRAINASDIGINPTNDGQTIRLVFPELTGERRKQLSKDVKKMGEDSKVALRNIRRKIAKREKNTRSRRDHNGRKRKMGKKAGTSQNSRTCAGSQGRGADP